MKGKGPKLAPLRWLLLLLLLPLLSQGHTGTRVFVVALVDEPRRPPAVPFSSSPRCANGTASWAGPNAANSNIRPACRVRVLHEESAADDGGPTHDHPATAAMTWKASATAASLVRFGENVVSGASLLRWVCSLCVFVGSSVRPLCSPAPPPTSRLL